MEKVLVRNCFTSSPLWRFVLLLSVASLFAGCLCPREPVKVTKNDNAFRIAFAWPNISTYTDELMSASGNHEAEENKLKEIFKSTVSLKNGKKFESVFTLSGQKGSLRPLPGTENDLTFSFEDALESSSIDLIEITNELLPPTSKTVSMKYQDLKTEPLLIATTYSEASHARPMGRIFCTLEKIEAFFIPRALALQCAEKTTTVYRPGIRVVGVSLEAEFRKISSAR